MFLAGHSLCNMKSTLSSLPYKEIKTLVTGTLEKGESHCPYWHKRKMVIGGCVHYGKMNAATHKNAFLLLRTKETLSHLTKGEFSKLVLAGRYW